MSLYHSEYFTANDGLRLHYLHWPQPNTKPKADSCCVLLHGFTNDAHIFDRLAESLQQHMPVFSVDARGHGDSAWDPQMQYTHDQLQDDLAIFLNTIQCQHFHLIGHSLGARVAMLLLQQQPQLKRRCQSFTIIDTGPEVSAIGVNKVRQDAENTPTEFANLQAFHQYLSNIYLLAEPNELQRLAQFGLKTINHVLRPKTDPAFAKALWKPDSHKGNSEDLSYPLNDQLWQALGQIDCPSLILRGQASAILSRKTALKMLDIMPNAELETISRAGHALMVDNPSEFIQAVEDFIFK
ncbi:MAG: alpha/beta hydrolase [Pseudomonadales bacterium]|nr:alpha/beta hydrolase [Pseudomonadales bacterium]